MNEHRRSTERQWGIYLIYGVGLGSLEGRITFSGRHSGICLVYSGLTVGTLLFTQEDAILPEILQFPHTNLSER